MSSDDHGQALPPEVRNALDDARAHHRSLSLVFRLRTGSGQTAPEPDEVSRRTRELLDLVASRTRSQPVRHNVFPNLATMVVEANPDFLETLAHQPHVDCVALNRRPGAGISPVPPVKRRAPKPGDCVELKSRPPRPGPKGPTRR